MQFEVIRKSHKKEIIIGISLLIILGVVLIARFTFAKYELVKSIKIAEGTINYKVPDFKIMAMYKQKDDATCTEDSCYNEMAEDEVMPESGYTINEAKSYCELNGSKDSNAKIYTDDDGNHVISKITKGSRCYLYFDKKISANETILINTTINSGIPTFWKISHPTCNIVYKGLCEITNGLYKAQDNDGTSYYFRGSVENNYVKFANFYWRIIRINGDGSIRLIYDGTSAHANGTVTIDSVLFKSLFSKADGYYATLDSTEYIKDNAYVGFKYNLNNAHGLGNKSVVLENLETWYINNLQKYDYNIDIDAGFCGDRTAYKDGTGATSGGGIGQETTYYGPLIRMKNPALTCENSSDLYTIESSTKGNKSLTYPIGLITLDELIMGGTIGDIPNDTFYLYNGQKFWSISPCRTGQVGVLGAGSAGYSAVNSADNYIRPVINLRSDVKLTGKGTMTDPYIVS